VKEPLPQEVVEGAMLDQLRSSPGFEEFRVLVDKLAGDAILAMLSCPQSDVMEWRGRAQAYFDIVEKVNARVHAARELAIRLRRETEAASERERGDLEQEIERREREARTSYAG
jgi:class 3 adenylate cyclase